MCLRRYDETGRFAQWGKWSIGTGGYDLNWELYYEEEHFCRVPVVGCVGCYIEIYNDFGRENVEQVANVIMREYTNIQGMRNVDGC